MNLRLGLPIVFVFAFPNFILPVQAQVVPGTGQQIVEVFDDFEDPEWSFTLNLPKSSANIDKVERQPSGFSSNRLYLESLYRGTPDYVKRVETPPGGIPGSKGALAMQTMQSGVPGRLSHTFQQDDLIAGVQQRLGYILPVSWTPSYVCRVYVPPFDKWERRHGSHFGFRADCSTTITKKTTMGKLFKSVASHKVQEQYWPGFFIQLNMKEMTHEKEDYAQLVIRGDTLGHEVPGPKITRPGWWTLGMTFTADGKVHYYAHEGVASLTSKDHLYSNFPYGYHCEHTTTFFFNIVNQDDGHTWSTRWIVDDPKVFVATGSYRPPAQVAQVPAQKTAAASNPPAAALPAVPPVQVPAVPAAQVPALTPPPVQSTAKPVGQPQAAATPAPVAPAAAALPVLTPQPAATRTQPAYSLTTLGTVPVAAPITRTAGSAADLNRTATPAAATAVPKAVNKPAAASTSLKTFSAGSQAEHTADQQGPVPNLAPVAVGESLKPAAALPVIDDSAAPAALPN